ncbi:MAG TPA: hypothetical protein VFC44_17450 [Candidatus Saccharimonadales bacterium]|nr:hypothetical protein [Candidatus Saccharimonadales bacterium]
MTRTINAATYLHLGNSPLAGQITFSQNAAGAVLAIAAAVNGSHETANSVDAYRKDLAAGDRAYADLDAVKVAIGVQERRGNYFVTDDVLSTLMQ